MLSADQVFVILQNFYMGTVHTHIYSYTILYKHIHIDMHIDLSFYIKQQTEKSNVSVFKRIKKNLTEMVDNNNNISSDPREGFNYNFTGDGHHHDEVIKEQDRLLPIANVGRIMKQILPPNAKISKEAKETMQECVSEFISFVTGEASDKCHKEKRKTVNGDDICWALSTLGFDDYSEPLKRYLHRFRELEGEKAQHSKANSGGEDQRNEAVEVSPTRATVTSSSTPFMKFNVINERGNSSIPRRF